MSGYTARSTLKYFKKGAEVEICSNDAGFRGSLFAGTVVGPPKRVSAKVVVQYKTLVNENDETKPLKESVNLVQLRPPPPLEKRLVYEISDEVDAYHNDGWWEGIITRKFKEDNVIQYAVFFRGTREEMVFDASQLRLHREWVYGEWQPPVDPSLVPAVNETPSPAEVEANKEVTEHGFRRTPSTAKVEAKHKSKRTRSSAGGEAKHESKRTRSPAKVKAKHELKRTPSSALEKGKKKVTEHEFNPGDIVEASSNDEGFQGARFVATVVKKTTAGRYEIEYQNLRNDDDTKFLREEVDEVFLRPCPPEIGSVDSFALNDEVDAFHNDGWWAGAISRILKNDRYYVHFEDPSEELMFEHSDLRVHQEWRNGKWHTGS